MAWSIRIFLSLWILLVTLSVPPQILQAQADAQAGETQIQLQNVPIQDEKLLVVNIYLTDLADLYGADVQLRYDPTRLAVRDDNRRLEGIQISPGPLIASDDRFVVTNAANPDTGKIGFAFTLLKPAPPISGAGVLATVVFEITGDGPYPVQVDSAQLVSSELTAIPATFQDLYLNGNLEPVSAPATPAAPATVNMRVWQWIAGVGVLALLIVLIGLVIFSTRWKSTPDDTLVQSPSRKMPKATHSTLRSAALLAEQGTHMFEQGDAQRAYELFSRAIELDPANVEAWLGKGLMAQQKTEKRICLQRVLALDPGNKTARDELRKLKMAM